MKGYNILIILIMAVMSSVCVLAIDWQSDNIAYYSFDTNYTPDNGNWTTTPNGDPTQVTGILGNAYEYDGNDYFYVESNIYEYDIMVMAGWFYLPANGTYAHIVDSHPTAVRDAFIHRPSTIFTRGYWKGGIVQYNSNLEDGWHHFIIANDIEDAANNQTVRNLYIDGVFLASASIGNPPITTNLTLGIRGDLSAFGLVGKIDEFGIWNATIDDNNCSVSSSCGGDVATLYNSGTAYNPFAPLPDAELNHTGYPVNNSSIVSSSIPYTQNFEFIFTFTDDIFNCSLHENGSIVNTTEYNFSVSDTYNISRTYTSQTGYGQYLYDISCDGNSTDNLTLNILIDNTAPVIDIRSPINDSRWSDLVNSTVYYYDDNLYNVSTVLYYPNGSVAYSYSTTTASSNTSIIQSIDSSSMPDGSYTFSARGCDGESSELNCIEENTSIIMDTISLDLLFENETSDYKTEFFQYEEVLIEGNLTYSSDDSSINDSSCSVTFYNLSERQDAGDQNFTVCSASCEYTIYSQSISFEDSVGAESDRFDFFACHEGMSSSNITLNMTCAGGSQQQVIPASSIPDCSSTEVRILGNDLTACTGQTAVNFSIVDGTAAASIRVSGLHYNRKYSQHTDSGSDFAYNSTSGYYRLHDTYESDSPGIFQVDSYCEGYGYNVTRSENITIGNLPPFIDIDSVRTPGGITSLVQLAEVGYYTGIWTFNVVVSDNDIDTLIMNITASDGTLLYSWGSVQNFTIPSTVFNADSIENPYTLSVWSNDTDNGTSSDSIQFFVVTPTEEEERAGLLGSLVIANPPTITDLGFMLFLFILCVAITTWSSHSKERGYWLISGICWIIFGMYIIQYTPAFGFVFIMLGGLMGIMKVMD